MWVQTALVEARRAREERDLDAYEEALRTGHADGEAAQAAALAAIRMDSQRWEAEAMRSQSALAEAQNTRGSTLDDVEAARRHSAGLGWRCCK